MRFIDTAALRLTGPRTRGPVARLLWYGAAVAGVAIITVALALLQGDVEPGLLQGIYLLLVLALAIGGGSGPAILASVLAFVSVDWWFLGPVGELVPGDAEQWFALALFLVVSVSTGSLAAGLQRNAAEARRRTRETTTLYELSIAILADTSLEQVLSTIVERLRAVLGLRAATIFLAAEDRLGLTACAGAEGTGSADPDLRHLHATRGDGALAGGTAAHPVLGEDGARLQVVYAPLQLNGRSLGILAAYRGAEEPPLSVESLRLLDAFAAQTSLAIGRVRLLEEEERAQAAADSERLKSSFLASISHDLRTPLTAIRTAAALLHSEPDRATRREAKDHIDSEIDRLNHLVDNLLEMSRIESGSAAPRLAPEDLSELVGVTADRLAPMLNGRRFELSATAELPLIPLDAAQIGRALTNLIENAIKFSPAGSTISVRVGIEDGAATVRVHNPGPPIPPDQQESIFDRFHRVEREASAARGTGLGLAICKAIVEAHGGSVRTHNEDGGVAFYLSLPLPVREDAPTGEREAVTAA